MSKKCPKMPKSGSGKCPNPGASLFSVSDVQTYSAEGVIARRYLDLSVSGKVPNSEQIMLESRSPPVFLEHVQTSSTGSVITHTQLVGSCMRMTA